MPEHHRAGERQEGTLVAIEPTSELAQIGKPHADLRDIALGDAGGGERRRAQPFERSLVTRHIEGEMGALVDEAEKDEFAAGKAVLDIAIAQGADERPDRIDGQYRGARLATLYLDDEVLAAPDRNKHAFR